MHIIRRLPDRRRLGVLAAVSIVTVGSVTASCGGNDSSSPSSDDAGSPDVTTVDASGADVITVDASGDGDAADGGSVQPPDAGAPFDGGPLPVVCSSTPCATSLTTSSGSRRSQTPWGSFSGEGFCALLQDGTVVCWGQNEGGQLGRGQDAGVGNGATAERVVNLTNIVALEHNCAIDNTGATWCWGTGPYLRSKASAWTTELTPVKLPIPPATSVGVAADFSDSFPDEMTACATVDGGVLCWGANTNGEVAMPSPDASSSAPLTPQPVSVPSGAPITNISMGLAAIALRQDRTAVSWGANPPLARVSSLFPNPNPAPIGLTGVTSVDVEDDNGCATAGGAAYCWGSAGYGEAPLARALPERVPTPEPVVQIATTSGLHYSGNAQRACAVGASGAVYCWGDNSHGQAGDGTHDYALHPVKVVGLPGPAAQIKTASLSTCALLTSGKIFCWGDDFYGQLGSGKFQEPSVTPNEVKLP